MDLEEVLTKNRQKIFYTLSSILHTKGSDKYRQRPFKELLTTTSRATDGFYNVLVRDDFSKIDSFIEEIAELRLKSGFLMSDVQKAFDLYRTTVVPMLGKTLEREDLLRALEELNLCFTYTITTFSDCFQTLHEKQVREYAQNLEREVARRTKDLSESEAKYRVLVEEINDGYFVHQNGVILFANKAFCDMHGYTIDELVGRQYLDLTLPVAAADSKGFSVKRWGLEEKAGQHTYYRLRRDGSILPTESKTKSIMYQGKRATAGICRDITERVKMEAQIREAENLAHIGQLSSSLAHEIRNPLSSVKMSIQMLLKAAVLDGKSRRTMEISSGEIARLERILEQMLDLAKPVNLTLEVSSINSLIDSCLEILDSKLVEKNLRVKKKLSPAIMPLLLDKEKMEQVILNILLNAIEMLPTGGRLSVVTKQEGDPQAGVCVEISDNGPGVSIADLPYIFDPFFSTKKKGTGLGLANVKKIVEAHGGSVRAFRMRKGLCMSFHLPAKKPT